MTCPNQELLVRFAEGDLTAEERSLVDEHLSVCSACWAVVGGLLGPTFESNTTSAFAGADPIVRRGTTLGRYIVLRYVGSGAHGVVYAAHDPELNRQVALKLHNPRALESNPARRHELRQRLMREAQVMARLSSPEVVPVYDAGTCGEQLFVAMELVEGESLAEWLAARPRPWQEIVRVFIKAGRGLAAAHAAGIVHRDFKPANVLVGREGRVRVTDFGLAYHSQAFPLDSVEPVSSEAGRSDESSAPLTTTGEVLGTLGYAPFEQLAGRSTDALSDQFSYCVSLFEALYGERPFAGRTVVELQEQIRDGKLRQTPRSRVPRWLNHLVVRGLAAEPSARFPSMDDLLRALSAGIARARWRWIGLAATLAVAASVAATYAVVNHGAGEPCTQPKRMLERIWNAAQASALKSAFAATGLDYAETSYSTVERVFSRYGVQWTERYASACESQSMRPGRADATLAARMSCLDRRLLELSALIETLSSPDPEVVQRAPQAAAALTPLLACDNASPPAGDGKEDTQHEHETELREALARAKALSHLGKAARALEILAPLVAASAQGSSAEALRAELLRAQGTAESDLGHYDAAQALLRESALISQKSRDDEGAAQSYLALVLIVAFRQEDARLARVFYDQAEVSVSHLEGREDLRARLEDAATTIAYRESTDPEATYQHALATVALYKRVFGTDSLALVRPWGLLAQLTGIRGDLRQAVEMQKQVLALHESQLGSMHPGVADTVNNLAFAHLCNGDWNEAVELNRRAFAIRRHARGQANPLTAWSLANVGESLFFAGKVQQALATFEEACPLMQKGYGPRHPRVAWCLHRLSAVLTGLGRHDSAREKLHEGLQLLISNQQTESPAMFEYQLSLGDSDLMLGQRQEALQHFEEAHSLAEKLHVIPEDLGRAELRLGRLLDALGRERDKAHELVRRSEEHLARAAAYHRQDWAEAKEWLKDHSG